MTTVSMISIVVGLFSIFVGLFTIFAHGECAMFLIVNFFFWPFLKSFICPRFDPFS